MKRLTFLGTVAALLLATDAPLLAQGSLPQGEGRDLVATACTQCHTLATIVVGREGPAGWKGHVYNMVLRGAQLTEPEADTVIRYLAVNFGPGAVQPGKVTLPAGPGKELVETRCATCHDLERVAVIKRPRQHWPAIVINMVTRGAVATPDEARAIASYLMAQFGSD
jgi:mono/diheme cytochrome c family protein